MTLADTFSAFACGICLMGTLGALSDRRSGAVACGVFFTLLNAYFAWLH